MNALSSQVYWYSQKAPEPKESFFGELQSTVLVIGGGVAGLSCAQTLHEAGVPVVLIERDFCGAGASGKTSGFITPDSELELSSLLRNHGPEKARDIWEFVLSGVSKIRENIKRYDISCDLQVQDSLFVASTNSGFKAVRREHEARQQLGYASVLYGKEELKGALGSEAYKGAVRYPETFGINSYLYCLALRDALRAAGVPIHEGTAAERIEGKTVFTANGKIQAEHILICTDRFIPEMGALKKEIYHVQTFLGVTKPLSEKQIERIFPDKALMVWDTELVYNYFRVTGDRRLLIGGGDIFKTYARKTVTNMKRFEERLQNHIHSQFPGLKLEMETVWPGMLGVSKDLLPIMGPDEKNKRIWYVGAATGLPWAAALGSYAAEKVVNGRKDFDEEFSPKRSFAIGPRLQSFLGNPVTYALSHGASKYL